MKEPYDVADTLYLLAKQAKDMSADLGSLQIIPALIVAGAILIASDEIAEIAEKIDKLVEVTAAAHNIDVSEL